MGRLSATLALCLCVIGCGDDAGNAGGAGDSGSPDAAGTGAGRGGSGGTGASGSGGRGGAGGSAGRAPAGGSGGTAPDPGTKLPMLGAPVTPGDPGSADVMLEARTDQNLRAISPLVYGMNGAPDIARSRFTVVRSGGNRLTAYNWENNASNAGSDYQFQNDNYLSNSNEPAKPVLDPLREAAQHEAAFIATVPIVDYVSADKNGGGDVRNSGSNYLSTRFKKNKPDKGSAPAAMPDQSDDSVYQDEFVAYLKGHAPAGSRVLFSLDNEPDLWSHTHAEVHPMPVTYAELWDRNQRFATAIKGAWPEAAVLGFVSYGWNGYVNLQNASDAMGRDFIDWYLDQAKAAEAKAGKRLIDYLDLHWYPEAQGGGTRVTENDSSAAVASARVQAPRSLWDKTYNEKSWVHDYLNGPIYLVPRLLAKIEAHYPGTKLAFTEWNYGGGNHISGALACADVLGVFGREGVSLATYWPLSNTETFSYAAFRVYRNYDGAGAAFGDTSLPVTTSDVANVTAYASLDAANPDRVVIVAINKADASKTVALRLAHPTMFGKAESYRLATGSVELAKQADETAAATNAWKLTLPAQSVTVLVPKK